MHLKSEVFKMALSGNRNLMAISSILLPVLDTFSDEAEVEIEKYGVVIKDGDFTYIFRPLSLDERLKYYPTGFLKYFPKWLFKKFYLTSLNVSFNGISTNFARPKSKIEVEVKIPFPKPEQVPMSTEFNTDEIFLDLKNFLAYLLETNKNSWLNLSSTTFKLVKKNNSPQVVIELSREIQDQKGYRNITPEELPLEDYPLLPEVLQKVNSLGGLLVDLSAYYQYGKYYDLDIVWSWGNVRLIYRCFGKALK